MSAKGRLRRVGTRLVPPAPAAVEPLLLGTREDGEGDGSPLVEAVKGASVLAAVVVVSGSVTLWGLHQQGWFGL